MAYITTNAPLTGSAPVRGYIESLFTRLQAWRMHRRTVAELSALSDRELDDIGLIRSQIGNYALTAK